MEWIIQDAQERRSQVSLVKKIFNFNICIYIISMWTQYALFEHGYCCITKRLTSRKEENPWVHLLTEVYINNLGWNVAYYQ